MSKLIKYKGVSVNKPDNISTKLVKKVIDFYGDQITVDQAIKLVSEDRIRFDNKKIGLSEK